MENYFYGFAWILCNKKNFTPFSFTHKIENQQLDEIFVKSAEFLTVRSNSINRVKPTCFFGE